MFIKLLQIYKEKKLKKCSKFLNAIFFKKNYNQYFLNYNIKIFITKNNLEITFKNKIVLYLKTSNYLIHLI